MMTRRWSNTGRAITGRFTLQRYKGLGEMDAAAALGDHPESGDTGC